MAGGSLIRIGNISVQIGTLSDFFSFYLFPFAFLRAWNFKACLFSFVVGGQRLFFSVYRQTPWASLCQGKKSIFVQMEWPGCQARLQRSVQMQTAATAIIRCWVWGEGRERKIVKKIDTNDTAGWITYLFIRLFLLDRLFAFLSVNSGWWGGSRCWESLIDQSQMQYGSNLRI